MSEWFAAIPAPATTARGRSSKLRACLESALNEIQALKKILKKGTTDGLPMTAVDDLVPPKSDSSNPKTMADISCQTDGLSTATPNQYMTATCHTQATTPISAASRLFSNSLFRDNSDDQPSSDEHSSPADWGEYAQATTTHVDIEEASEEQCLGSETIPDQHEERDDTNPKSKDQTAMMPPFSFDGSSAKAGRERHRSGNQKQRTMTPIASPAPPSPFMISTRMMGEAESLMRGL